MRSIWTSPQIDESLSSAGALASKILLGVLVATVRCARGLPGPSPDGLAVPERWRPQSWTTAAVSPISFVVCDDRKVVMTSPATLADPSLRRLGELSSSRRAH